MVDHNGKIYHGSSYPLIPTNQTMNTRFLHISSVSQGSSRPNTLQINAQHANSSLFTPGDYSKLNLSTPEMDDKLRGYSTPDLINVLENPSTIHEQPSPGVKIFDDLIPTNFDHDNMKRENILAYPINQTLPPSLHDNDSSNSLSSSTSNSNRNKEELQNVPSNSGEPQHDLFRKEKKRERNRQAAQKCRTRKLTRIAELQQRVEELQGKNKNLEGVAECLQIDIKRLERQLQDHQTQGCTLTNGSLTCL